MKTIRTISFPAIAAIATIGVAPFSHAAVVIPVTGWAVHNGTASTITNGGTNTPTFGTADNNTVMGRFGNIELNNNGDFLKVTTTLTVGTRTTNTGVNSLNTQLRIGLFNGPAGAVVANDIP